MSLLLSLPFAAQAKTTNRAKFVRALDRMMVQLGRESARDSRTIKKAYRDHLELLVLDEYGQLQGALATGGLAPLPPNPLRFNLAPRLDGPSPIGEKDLEHQVSYIAARPATIGALIDVASRVTSGPIEITSMVRHTEYQGALRATNRNATTSVPMHTMGLAFDIALVNTPLDTVYEIRDVLRRMRKAGDILFIGERKQLVFHVVPHPSRLGHFTEVYVRALGAPPSANGTPVVAFSKVRGPKRAKGRPVVTVEVVAVVPSRDVASEWWAADHSHADLEVQVTAAAAPEPPPAPPAPPSSAVPPRTSSAAGVVVPLLPVLALLTTVSWRVVRGRRESAVLFQRA